MGIFDRKRKVEDLPSLFAPGELMPHESPIEYEQVLEYLVGLSDQDFTTITQVAVVYRTADTECAKIMGKKSVKPTTFINPPDTKFQDELKKQMAADSNHEFLDDDDELNIAFLEDEPKTKTPAKKPLGNRSKAKS